MPTTYVWFVRKKPDIVNALAVDLGVYDTEDAAYEANKTISGIMGQPPTLGGEIWKLTLNTYPIEQELVFGKRTDWNGDQGYGWLDLRDQPDTEDPDWIEYQRLRAIFSPINPNIYPFD